MTSQPDNPPTTARSQGFLIDCLDIVATQGACLLPPARTPVFQKAYDAQFAAKLEMHLKAVVIQQICRNVMYHGAADEWPIGHTPPELKEKRKAELKALEELYGYSDDSSDDNHDDKDRGGDDTDVRPGPVNSVPSDCSRRPHQGDSLPTPPLTISHVGKRRREFKEDENRESAAKKHASFSQGLSTAAEHSVSNTVKQQGDEEEEVRPSKVQVTTACART